MGWPSTITFAEMHGYPVSHWQLGEFTATRKLICDWSDRVQLLLDIGGSWEGLSYPYPDGPVDGAARSTAFAYSVTTAALPAEEREDTALSATKQQSLAEYDKAVLTVLYSNRGMQYDSGSGNYYTEKFAPVALHESIDNTKLHWVNGSGPMVKPAMGKIFYGWEYTLILHWQTGFPINVGTLIGSTNQNALVTYSGPSYAAETLLYTPPTVEHSATMGSLDKWVVTYRYTYHPWGWNKFWRVETEAFESIFRADGTRYIQYPLAVW